MNASERPGGAEDPLEPFHDTVKGWFRERLGDPSPPQRDGWPRIRAGQNVLIAAPTGSGKTLAAFLAALDELLRLGERLAEQTTVLYVSPLKALGNDVRKNLEEPLAELRARNPELPEVRVAVRSGDTPASERTRMLRKPPHILVTTPESLFILMSSRGGRDLLRTVRVAILDEIHAVAADRRGAHLMLSLERLEALCGRRVQRIGLSATQKPLALVADFLGGVGRSVEIIDSGHLKAMEVELKLPRSPLGAVCAHEVWEEIYESIAEETQSARTTLIFVGSRKLAERVSARLGQVLGEDLVGCHHSSLAKERRLDAENRLKRGEYRALVATASLELGIDIGDVDLVVQVGSVRRIATFLQRLGRAGHRASAISRGRLYPLTRDELIEALALLRALHEGELDRILMPLSPFDILTQHLVSACAHEPFEEEALYELFRRAHPYRNLTRAQFDDCVALHTSSRTALLHRDEVRGILRGTRRAPMAAILSGGAIPDNANYRVVEEPHGHQVGTVDEDFAVESSAGDIFQLGATSWRVLKVEPGTMRVADAEGAPPSLPFWLGEGPVRSEELSRLVGEVRETLLNDSATLSLPGVPEEALARAEEYVREGVRVLGAVPTQKRLILERFFDQTGGMQLVLHAPFGSRLNRAFGLALRKCFCRQFGFELQAAANEEAILLSLGPQHSFELEEVFTYLNPETVAKALRQAVLVLPLFQTRWRWNVTRSLVVERGAGSKRVPPPLLRMRADDALVKAFPAATACFETLPPGDIEIPLDHILVYQTMHDCLEEAMDVRGLQTLLKRMRAREVEQVALDTREPSAFADSILNAQPYTFLDDAPLEERRTQAVLRTRGTETSTGEKALELDPEAVARVCEEVWPDPRDAEEVHETLTWIGYVTHEEARPWSKFLGELESQGRIVREGDRIYARETGRNAVALLRGRMEALGPVCMERPTAEMLALESEGRVMRTRFQGQLAFCDRRLLARIHKAMLESLRSRIKPVSAADYVRFLAHWQHVANGERLEGPEGVRQVLTQLAGFELTARAWERDVLPLRVQGYRKEWLDQLTMGGEFVWGRLTSSGQGALSTVPIAFFPRLEWDLWMALAPPPAPMELPRAGRAVHEALEARGPCFYQDLQRSVRLLPAELERGLAEGMAAGLITSDGFAAPRQLMAPSKKRRHALFAPGRFSLFRSASTCVESEPRPDEEQLLFDLARALLRRYGVVFRRLLDRERLKVPWRSLLLTYRTLERRGEVRGGRFVAGFHGEQFALEDTIAKMRRVRSQKSEAPALPEICYEDPLNLRGILTPENRAALRGTAKIAVL